MDSFYRAHSSEIFRADGDTFFYHYFVPEGTASNEPAFLRSR